MTMRREHQLAPIIDQGTHVDDSYVYPAVLVLVPSDCSTAFKGYLVHHAQQPVLRLRLTSRTERCPSRREGPLEEGGAEMNDR